MISDVLGDYGGSIIWFVVVMLASIIAFIGIVIWSVRLKKQDVLKLSRLPIDDEGPFEEKGTDHGGV